MAATISKRKASTTHPGGRSAPAGRLLSSKSGGKVTRSIAQKIKPKAVKRDPRYAVDPMSPEFTDALMKCFAEGKRKALAESARKQYMFPSDA